jgi:hypothetical protein
MNPFDYLNSINWTKKNIMKDDIDEKGYNAFLINRSLSYFQDTVSYANIMNQYHHLDNRLQYDFYINIIRQRKRFSKWIKPETSEDIEVIMEYYGYSNEKARQALPLLSSEQLKQIRQKVDKGGRRTNN